MIRTELFDFAKIANMNEFYKQYQQRFMLPAWFGQNLDALWDTLTAEIELPVCIIFTHFDQDKELQFSQLCALLNDAAAELPEQLKFECWLADSKDG